jgi:hypothetical protein
MGPPIIGTETMCNDTWAAVIPRISVGFTITKDLYNQLRPHSPPKLKEPLNEEVQRKDLTSWKEQIKERDSVCKCCGGEKQLVCHHVYPFKSYPKLRDDPNNGVLL